MNAVNKDQGVLSSRILFGMSETKRIKRSVMDRDESLDYDREDERLDYSMDEEDAKYNVTEEQPPAFSKTGRPLVLRDKKHSEEELANWKKNFHFASFPLYKFGNWIPFVMARWPCLGTGCGLPQVAFKNSEGKCKQIHA